MGKNMFETNFMWRKKKPNNCTQLHLKTLKYTN